MVPNLVKEYHSTTLKAHIDKRVKGEAHEGTEHSLQRAFFSWLAEYAIKNEQFRNWLFLAHAIPNGGQRNKVTASLLKAEGVKAGIPDVFIPLPNMRKHGLYIEFKAKNGALSEDQIVILNALDEVGYQVNVIDNLQVAKQTMIDYLHG